jgi:NitT/TauT family transport system ATP-binding protein
MNPEPTTVLEVTSLAKTYTSRTATVRALADVSFTASAGELLCIVGPSGAGKTTLLQILCGITRPTGGEVRLNGKPVTGPPEQMALVFQDYSRSLFPWMRVGQNVEFPLKRRVRDRDERERLVREAIGAVNLTGFEHSYPWQLSGGMQQRVAIARALAYRPEILLMDEPFASVDAQTRGELEDLALRLRAEFGVTIILVTHDIDEAVYLADRVVVLTNRPTVVHETLPVPLPQQRDQVTTKELPEFSHLRAHVYKAITGMAAPPSQPGSASEHATAASGARGSGSAVRHLATRSRALVSSLRRRE